MSRTTPVIGPSMQQWHRVVKNGTTYQMFEVLAKVRKASRAENAGVDVDLDLVCLQAIEYTWQL